MQQERLSHEDFIRQAIIRLRDISRSRGIHAVFSGFNSAFRQYFNEDPVAVVQELARKGRIEVRPRKGGVMLYLPGEAPKSDPDLGKGALAKILDDTPRKPEDVFKKVIDGIMTDDIGRKTKGQEKESPR